MAEVRDFKDLIVWQRAMELGEEVYRATSRLPEEEKFGLKSQMRRCAVSIPSNIAEGKKRGSIGDYVQFLRVADGSAAELETQILVAQRLFGTEDFDRAMTLLLDVQRMLGKMISTLLKKKKDS